MNTAVGADKTILLLRPQDIRGLITVEEAIDLIEQGYREAQDFPLVNAHCGWFECSAGQRRLDRDWTS